MAATARVKYILNTFDLTIGKMTRKITKLQPIKSNFNQSKRTLEKHIPPES
jgi:hypothetical protein